MVKEEDEECPSPRCWHATTDAYLVDLVSPEKAAAQPVADDDDPMNVVDAALNRLGTDDIEDCSVRGVLYCNVADIEFKAPPPCQKPLSCSYCKVTRTVDHVVVGLNSTPAKTLPAYR